MIPGAKDNPIISVLTWRGFHFAAAVITILALTWYFAFSTMVSRWLVETERFEAVEAVEGQANLIMSSLQGEVSRVDLISQAVSVAVERDPDMDLGEYAGIIAPLARDAPWLINLGTSIDYELEYVYPISGNEGALGADYRDIPEQLQGVQDVMSTAQPTLIGPIDLIQGGTGLVLRRPTIAAPGDDAIAARGVVSLVMDRDILLEHALSGVDISGLDVAIRKSGNETGADRVLWGDGAIFAQQPIIRAVSVPSGTWEIAVIPARGWPTTTALVGPARVAVALFCALAAVVVLTLWVLYRTKQIAESQLRSAIEAIDDGFAIFDANDRLVYANDEYRSYYSRSRDAIVPGNSFEEIARTGVERGEYPEAFGREEEWLRERLAAHLNPSGHTEEQLSDGRWLKIAEARTSDGNIVGFRVDVTELKRAKQEAEAANQAKTTFMNVVSHELRTPLTSVIGYARFIENLQILPSFKALEAAVASDQSLGDKREAISALAADVSAMANRVIVSSDHLLSLINDVLDRSKLVTEDIRIDSEPVELQDLVRPVTTALEVKAREKGIRLVSTVDHAAFTGDAFRIRQVLFNVIGNAIKFTDEGQVHVHSTADAETVRIIVEDSGCGIAPDERDRIFDEFTQIDDSVTRRNNGTGLGLAITRQIMTLHGGTISVTASPSGGSRFTLSFPRHDAGQGAWSDDQKINLSIGL